MIEREATNCWDCPFAEKRDWSNDESSGTDIEDCALGGAPKEMAHYEARRQLGKIHPPDWCKLRQGDALVKLRKAP